VATTGDDLRTRHATNIKVQSTVKAKYTRFSGPVLRGIVLIVALYASISLLRGLLFGGKWEAAALVFIFASLTLQAMIPKPETLPPVEGESSLKAGMRRLPDWSVVAYCVVTGLSSTWACVFLWFSRRYVFFSGPVLGVTGSILAVYSAIGFLVARLIGGNWRTVLMVFILESWGLSCIVLKKTGDRRDVPQFQPTPQTRRVPAGSDGDQCLHPLRHSTGKKIAESVLLSLSARGCSG